MQHIDPKTGEDTEDDETITCPRCLGCGRVFIEGTFDTFVRPCKCDGGRITVRITKGSE